MFKTVEKVTELKNKNEGWKTRDATAQKIIVTTMDRKPMIHVFTCITANEMWIKLHTIYQMNTAQKCNLMRELYFLKYNKGSDMGEQIRESCVQTENPAS